MKRSDHTGVLTSQPDPLPTPSAIPLQGHTKTKLCFVTVGATASFPRLIQAVLAPAFLDTLHQHNYTDLRIQYGKDGEEVYSRCFWALDEGVLASSNIRITGFEFNKDGLRQEMLAAKRRYTASSLEGLEGCMISHAGMYTINLTRQTID